MWRGKIHSAALVWVELITFIRLNTLKFSIINLFHRTICTCVPSGPFWGPVFIICKKHIKKIPRSNSKSQHLLILFLFQITLPSLFFYFFLKKKDKIALSDSVYQLTAISSFISNIPLLHAAVYSNFPT